MHAKHLFEYAVIRLVPRVEREEFLNAGVILYSQAAAFLGTAFELNEVRLRAFSPELDLTDLHAQLHAFQRICRGDAGAGPIAALDTASRFRWLTATRSTVVQTSKVHPGFCADPSDALERLFAQLVL